MRSMRQSRQSRFSGGPGAASGGGGGIPTLTTAPTKLGAVPEYTSSGSDTQVVPGADLTGDLVIGIMACTNTSGPTLVPDTAADGTLLAQIDAGSSPANAFAIDYRRTSGDGESHSVSGGQANPGCTVYGAWAFTDSTGDPILLESGIFSTDAGWTRSGSTLTFPEVDVPAGYECVWIISGGDGYTIGTPTWGGGPVRSSNFSTTNGFDGCLESARIVTETSAVTATLAINLAFTVPVIGAIFLVPGT